MGPMIQPFQRRNRAIRVLAIARPQKLRLPYRLGIDREHLARLRARREQQVFESWKRTYLGTLSHELRTPLTIIHAYSRLIETGKLGTLSREQQTGIEVIVAQSQVLSNLVNELIASGRCGGRS